MSGLFSAVGRGLSAAGYGAGEYYAKSALMDQESALATNRAMRLAEFQEELSIRGIKPKAQATAEATRDAAPILAEANSVAAKGKADDELANAPTKRKALMESEYSPEITDAKARQVGAEATARSDAETKALIKRGNDPAAIRAARNLAQATHIEGLGSVTQAKLAQMSIDEKVKVNGMIEEFTTTKDPERKAAIKEALTVRGIIKPGEYDTEKVTEEKMNPDGTTTKTERTQKRRADGGGGGGQKQDVRVAGQVIGQASTPEEAREMVAKWKAGQGGAPERKPAPAASGGTSGSHTAPAADASQDRALRAQIMEKRERLQLRGISDETKLQLQIELRDLESRLNGKTTLLR